MASEVSVCNRALQMLGAKRITALDENSVNSRACNACIAAIRDALLEKHVWNCSIKRAILAADAIAPAWGRANAFTLPADFIKLAPDYPEDNWQARDYQIESGKIVTDFSAPLYIRYVGRITDVNQMPPLFRELWSTEMALAMCEELTQSNTKKQLLVDDAKKIIAEAKRSNAFQNVPATSAEDSWITCRT
jgi:hypothetical protein